ncbi:hypothetical protein conserved [Leishmania donovani]|uniref:Uncharacterized protein n=3 Tax=Leishmania donovani species complex TaxID=38574 RepID=A4IBX0_LEIIN|nr:conserved hypothetical protein [Leishmania infantum JPCM5]XP_003865015.1 hypothetical protein, conserved [Leishmania donovani]CAC9546759.1 hypothetical_protein_-_conserved [Leishmania infantum]CAJ1993248.1 hypothetical protein conserved [Leishmania donovani]CAM72342.1 conserved hypothetical protein [Leishmania infantum JPCM5]CBZ38336.1 hypothetical protein, conserved [Leishmania donovani]SUZ46261.1 hypothetical_protein_-_conserved [Leishmania infantum]|eukprot:XP_001469239.1 conserved hypothetical protein [Leishmania infantum JPCM5]
MKRFSSVLPAAVLGYGSATAVRAHRRYAAAVADADERVNAQQQQDEKPEAHRQQQQRTAAEENALGSTADEEPPRRRNIVVLSNTTKAVYVHPTNHIASWYWFITDFHKWFVGIVFLFVGTQVIARYRVSKLQTATQAQLGENLLDQRTRDLLSDIEVLRKKDPIRLEHEANIYHEQFWKRRALAVASSRNEVRSLEIQRGKMQGEARGTDMTEWLGAKAKDDEEREVARRTQDYIQGFHQHLKSKRLI